MAGALRVEMPEATLRTKGGHDNDARRALIYLCREHTLSSAGVLGSTFGCSHSGDQQDGPPSRSPTVEGQTAWPSARQDRDPDTREVVS